MRKIAGIVVNMAVIFGLGLSVVQAETVTYTEDVYRVADTPNKYGFKGLYMINSPSTYQQGKFGIGVYWEMSRFCLPGDPRYPQLQEISLVGGYGITDKLEVGIAAPFRMLNIPKASSDGRWPEDEALKDIDENGFSNVSVGVRYNVIRLEEGFEMTPYVQAFLPTASDPEKGTGADNTRIHVGATVGMPLGIARLYAQAAYQIATAYDQDEQNFTELGGPDSNDRPRFEYFGTNPLYHEYGNTLFYGAGLAVSLNEEDTAELFAEALLYHSFEDEDYIPLFEDKHTAGQYDALDVVQDGGMAQLGAKIGFSNGLTVSGGGGAKLFALEPMYESPHWRVFVGLTYSSPTTVEYVVDRGIIPDEEQYNVGDANARQDFEIGGPRIIGGDYDCNDIFNTMVFFEFDKATLTPEAQTALDNLARLLRLCSQEVVEVQGHTDWDGTENYNMKLGARRARAVVYYLVYDQGLDPRRVVLSDKLNRTPQLIAGETYGESVPATSNESDAGRAQNRRAQFVKMGM